MASKKDFFRFVKDNDFAPAAIYSKRMDPRHYLDAVKRLIRSKAYFGFKLDEKLSSESKNIVFRRVKTGSFEIETPEANRQARAVLGLE